ncbi:NACHT domain-containing protein [Actinocrispum wychmicini]|uniref:Transcriptional regulator n=1 Tax=Actinocrispum wychmicini TaxID=1213861 RepID=A0A4R2JTG6_9PSEU|nr:NACHT domain-containing protein [Actinocrispum wychmicini]TCO60556.1 transcriptional regulator [Actinocrispum wychmicini]
MEFRVFGQVEGRDDAGLSVAISPTGRAILAVLLLHLGQPITTERLITLVWDKPCNADTFYRHVTELRRSLADVFGAAARLPRSKNSALQLDLTEEAVDYHRFRNHFQAGKIAFTKKEFRAALTELRQAMRQCQGHPLTGVSASDGMANLRVRLDGERQNACQLLINTLLTLGRYSDALAEIDFYRTQWRHDEFLAAARERAAAGRGQEVVAGNVISKARSVVRPVRRFIAGDAGEASLDAAAGQLADAVRRQWEHEEALRRIHDPFPLPVRWHTAPAELTDHWANVARASATTLADPFAEGDLDQVADMLREVRRLVVLGRAGSGKTILVMRLVLKLLASPDTDLVPVIFSLGSWNPAEVSMRDWLADQLSRDHPGLAARGPDNITLAAALVRDGRILPVLDGFDEIADGLHGAALRSLNTLTTPLVLTSRTAEFEAAITATDVLTNAAGIELDELTLRDLTAYLPRTTTRTALRDGETTPIWDPVLARLDSAGDLKKVLSTPLMVGLARAIYSDTREHDPVELLDTGRFGTADAVEAHLLNAFVPAVYRHPPLDRDRRRYRRWDPDLAHQWLHQLARQLNRLGTRDLLWWQLGRTVPRVVTLAAFAAVGALAASLTGMLFTMGLEFLLTFGLVAGLMYGLSYGLVPGLLVGVTFTFLGGAASRLTGVLAIGFGVRVAAGIVFSLAVGVLFGALVTKEPEPQSIKFRVRGRLPEITRRVLVGLAVGPLVGVTFGVAFDLAGGPSAELGTAITGGIAGGLIAGPMVGLIGGLAVAVDIRTAISPADLLKSSRTNAVVQSVAIGLVFGAAFGVAFEVMTGQAASLATGPAVGLVAGVVVGLGMTAWGRWVLVARVWFSLTNKQPWVMIAFLEDAHRRGVLRQAGAVYQFRHARLQDHLASVTLGG